jgi:hypothetical protein
LYALFIIGISVARATRLNQFSSAHNIIIPTKITKQILFDYYFTSGHGNKTQQTDQQ